MNGLDVLGYVAALCVLTLTAALLFSVFRPSARKAREVRRSMRELDRAERRKHLHQWTKWTHKKTVLIYPAGSTEATTLLPVKRKEVQERTCLDCGFVETNKEQTW